MFRRARWTTIGAVVAITLGGGLAIPGAQAAVSSGERDVFVPIVPCRLMDTRVAPDNVGPRATPLASQETYTQPVSGTNGNCTIPTDATGVAMNVTAVHGTSNSYLTVWPSDAPARPTASNLNWLAGAGATPNKVDVKLSADGKVNLFNNAGSVDVVADIVGFYADHNFDDRYYTKTQSDANYYSKSQSDANYYSKAQSDSNYYSKAQSDSNYYNKATVDSKLATKADKPSGILIVNQASFQLSDEISFGAPNPYRHQDLAGTLETVNGLDCFDTQVIFPDHVTITGAFMHATDSNTNNDLTARLYAQPTGIGSTAVVASITTTGSGPFGTTFAPTITGGAVSNGDTSYTASLCMYPNMLFYDLEFTYTNS